MFAQNWLYMNQLDLTYSLPASTIQIATNVLAQASLLQSVAVQGQLVITLLESYFHHYCQAQIKLEVELN